VASSVINAVSRLMFARRIGAMLAIDVLSILKLRADPPRSTSVRERYSYGRRRPCGFSSLLPSAAQTS
jgi:hypothetical protein